MSVRDTVISGHKFPQDECGAVAPSYGSVLLVQGQVGEYPETAAPLYPLGCED